MQGLSTILKFYYLMFSKLILKLCLYCREIIPLLLLFCFRSCFNTFLLFPCCNFMKNYFCPKLQQKSPEDRNWGSKLLFLNSLKFNLNKLKTLSQSLRRYCVKDVRKNIFMKTLYGRTEIH